MEVTADPVVVGRLSIADLVLRFFALMDQFGIEYCVLHGWKDLPDQVGTDVDVVVAPADRQRLGAVLAGLEAAGYLPIQCRNYAVHAYRFDFAWFQDEELAVVGLDLAFEYRYAGILLSSAKDLLQGRRRFNGFYVAAPRAEFVYLLMKKTVKGEISAAQQAHLRELAEELGPEAVRRAAIPLFGSKMGSIVGQACARNEIATLLPALRFRLWVRRMALEPWNLIRYWGPELLRWVRRLAHPTGMSVAVLGPDGAGKSTLLNSFTVLRPVFGEIRRYHWRPGVVRTLRNQGTPVPQPHAKAVHGFATSLASLLAVLADYIVGYWSSVRILMARSGLALFDRHLYDICVDPVRYRYAGPLWLAEFAARLAPPRHLLALILAAEENTILERNQEVAPGELRRQIAKYRWLASRWPAARLISADEPAAKVARRSLQHLCDFRVNEFWRMAPHWLRISERAVPHPSSLEIQ